MLLIKHAALRGLYGDGDQATTKIIRHTLHTRSLRQMATQDTQSHTWYLGTQTAPNPPKLTATRGNKSRTRANTAQHTDRRFQTKRHRDQYPQAWSGTQHVRMYGQDVHVL